MPKSATAEEMYKAAVYDMKRGLYPEAMKAFERIRARYPYSPFASLSDLRIADCHFESGRYLEAIESYRMFMQFHPRHPEASYAAYRIGEAHMKRAPRDWLIMPPVYEKDLSAVRQGVAVLEEFLRAHSGSAYEKEGRDLLLKGRTRLGQHELYVCRFYFKRQKYRAAIGRAQTILTDFRGTGLEVDAYLLAAQSYIHLNQYAQAADHLRRLQKEFPGSKGSQQAEELLHQISGQLSKPAAKTSKLPSALKGQYHG